MDDFTLSADASPEQKARLMRRATYASTSAAVFLILAKAFAWGISDAVSLLATLIDSVLDSFASLLNLLAVRHALTPADREHRFGHGKAEALSGLGQALFIAGSAGYLMFESARRLAAPAVPRAWDTGVAVMLLSIAVTLALLAFQRHVIRRTGSTAIRADSLHYRSDLLVNLGVIAALLLSGLGWAGFDALFALAIALYILRSAWAVGRGALDHLMDRELPESQRRAIRDRVMAHPQVRGMHDLRSRRAGTDTFVQLHLELDDELSLPEAHDISDAVEADLKEVFPGVELIIHTDPVSAAEAEAAPAPRKGGVGAGPNA